MLQIKTIDIDYAEYQKKVTVYYNDSVELKAAILYFHGGGLLYGTREDLPELHINTITNAGYAILSYDYPLAPVSTLEVIHKDVCDSVHNYLTHAEFYVGSKLPYFLWGRSAGAYLCLLAAAKGDFFVNPHGIISYYGYGFLCDNWFKTPSAYYKKFPAVPSSCMHNIEHLPIPGSGILWKLPPLRPDRKTHSLSQIQSAKFHSHSYFIPSLHTSDVHCTACSGISLSAAFPGQFRKPPVNLFLSGDILRSKALQHGLLGHTV